MKLERARMGTKNAGEMKYGYELGWWGFKHRWYKDLMLKSIIEVE